MKLQEALEALKWHTRTYPREAFDFALHHREEITPHLLDILTDVYKRADHYSKNKKTYVAHTYAAMLLTHFREQRAHPLFIKLFSLPGEMPFNLFEDVVTEDLKYFLYATCSGDFTQIKTMIENRRVNPYCRNAALFSLIYSVADGILKREDVMAYLSSLFPKSAKSNDLHLYTWLVDAAVDLYPQEVMEQIDQAFAWKLVDTTYIDYKFVVKRLESSVEKCIASLKDDLQRHVYCDFHKKIEWWACFDQLPRSSYPVKLSIPGKKKKKQKR